MIARAGCDRWPPGRPPAPRACGRTGASGAGWGWPRGLGPAPAAPAGRPRDRAGTGSSPGSRSSGWPRPPRTPRRPRACGTRSSADRWSGRSPVGCRRPGAIWVSGSASASTKWSDSAVGDELAGVHAVEGLGQEELGPQQAHPVDGQRGPRPVPAPGRPGSRTPWWPAPRVPRRPPSRRRSGRTSLSRPSRRRGDDRGRAVPGRWSPRRSMPSTVTSSPSCSWSVAPRAPTTAGSPISRLTMAAWQVRPPRSVTSAAARRRMGTQSGEVMGATSTSPAWRRSPSDGISQDPHGSGALTRARRPDRTRARVGPSGSGSAGEPGAVRRRRDRRGDRSGLDQPDGSLAVDGPLDVLGSAVVALDAQGQLGQGLDLDPVEHLQAELRGRQVDPSVTSVVAADDLELLTAEVEVHQVEVVAVAPRRCRARPGR